MKKFSFPILLLFATLLGLGFGSCSDDLDYRPNPVEEFDGVTISIPNPGMLRTRAADEAGIKPEEGKISDLQILLFEAGSGNLYKKIPVAMESLPEHENTNLIKLEYDDLLGQGVSSKAFKVYVAANLPSYLSAEDNNKFSGESFSESDFLAFKADFKNGESGYKLNSGYVGANGLPMAALHKDLSFNGNQISNGEAITIERGKKASIHADLAFLVAKVRLNVFFDNGNDTSDNGGFSKDIFTDNNFLNFNGSAISIAEVLNKTQVAGLSEDAKANLNLDGFSFSAREYPSMDVATYPADDNQINQDLGEGNIKNGQNRRAWQTTIYLPEQEKGIEMTLAALAEDGNGSKRGDLEYKLNLIPTVGEGTAAATGSKPIKRATAYDVTVRILGAQTLKAEKINVEPWTLDQLTYVLQGPVYLHIDHTRIENLASGERFGIWYDTNVSDNDLKGISPQVTVNGKEVDLFVFEKNETRDTLYVSLNSAIKSSDFQSVRDQLDKSAEKKFFHIQARTLYKTVQVDPIVLTRSFEVYPTTFAVDVRELMNSGKMDQEYYYFTVKTNIDKFSISKNTWASLSDGPLILEYQDAGNPDEYHQVDLSNTTDINMEPFTSGVVNFRITAKDINAGLDLYKKTTSQTFSLKPDNTGATGSEILGTKVVTVRVIPMNDNYVIHFRTPYGWNDLHCYAYQPLVIPMSYTGTDKNGTKIAGRVVGSMYRDDDPDQGLRGKYDGNACNEYIFTGKMAFKGWDVAANKECLEHKEDIELGGAGFVNITRWSKSGTDYGAWDNSNPQRFNTGDDYDFMMPYRGSMYCGKCKTGDYANGNVCSMESEGDGWWKITLPAVATPGQTFMIFTAAHGWNDTQRYPGNKQVGLPLPDYPSREAWIDYGSGMKSFTSENLQETGGGGGGDEDPNYKTLRLRWIHETSPGIARKDVQFAYIPDNSKDASGNSIRLTKNENGTADSSYDYAGTKESGNYSYIDFKVPTNQDGYGMKIWFFWRDGNAYNAKLKAITISSFQLNSSTGRYEYTVDNFN